MRCSATPHDDGGCVALSHPPTHETFSSKIRVQLSLSELMSSRALRALSLPTNKVFLRSSARAVGVGRPLELANGVGWWGGVSEAGRVLVRFFALGARLNPKVACCRYQRRVPVRFFALGAR